MKILDLGTREYDQGLALQHHHVEEVVDGGKDRLLLIEHPPVVTLGRHGGAEHLRLDAQALARRGVKLVQASRGGGATCHYPGQLVGYPIVRLPRHGGARKVITLVEEALLAAVGRMGVPATRMNQHPGVWVGTRKLGSIGLAIRRMVTFHGFSLNVSEDTSLFDALEPCGLTDVKLTSLEAELSRKVSMQEVKDAVAQGFRDRF